MDYALKQFVTLVLKIQIFAFNAVLIQFYTYCWRFVCVLMDFILLIKIFLSFALLVMLRVRSVLGMDWLGWIKDVTHVLTTSQYKPKTETLQHL